MKIIFNVGKLACWARCITLLVSYMYILLGKQGKNKIKYWEEKDSRSLEACCSEHFYHLSDSMNRIFRYIYIHISYMTRCSVWVYIVRGALLIACTTKPVQIKFPLLVHVRVCSYATFYPEARSASERKSDTAGKYYRAHAWLVWYTKKYIFIYIEEEANTSKHNTINVRLRSYLHLEPTEKLIRSKAQLLWGMYRMKAVVGACRLIKPARIIRDIQNPQGVSCNIVHILLPTYTHGRINFPW